MHSFLQKTVDLLCDKYADDISELCIVLPNRRAGLFLKTHFLHRLNKTFWSPEVFATEDFVAILSELQAAEPVTLLFELYEIVKKHQPEPKESFDEFSKWGQIFLADLNELDRYLVDAKQLFGNLKNIKELETWSLNTEPLTEFQQKYLSFWQSLGSYYHDFTAALLEKKMAYQGLAYRVVAENPVDRAKHRPWKKIIFAGFNALNKAEEVIISALLDAGMAEIIWDTDAYYLDDVNQEAGKFIRRYEHSGIFKKRDDAFALIKEELLLKGTKRIHVIGAAKNVAQAKLAGNLISELQQNDPKLEQTALVLADENLLFPVLHSLPEELKDINVTMGYPLKNTPVAGYFDLVFQLHETGRKAAEGKSKYSFYHRDLIKFLAHPYTANALGTASEKGIQEIVDRLYKSNLVFAAFTTIEKRLFGEQFKNEFELLRPVFSPWNSPGDALHTFRYLIDVLRQSITQQMQEREAARMNLELEYLFAFTKIIKRIQVLMTDFTGAVDSVKTLRSLFNQLVRTATLPFYGEPLMGLQVMGMLETRTLDFKQVVLLSCNEDILPSGKTVNSFIPYELKRHFGLPTYSDKDAIFAYHFYRLLQRAEEIYLVYNTEAGAVGGGEVSRFITQLSYELPKINPNAFIRHQLVHVPVISDTGSDAIVVEKDAAIIEKLMERAAYGFSPSAINKYRNCSLQFYFHALARLKESEEVDEVIGADVLGNAVHQVLEELYTPFVGKVIQLDDVKKMKQNAAEMVLRILTEQAASDVSFGKNLLILKVATKFVLNFLRNEEAYLLELKNLGQHLQIIGLEVPLEATIQSNGQEIRLQGKSDRIDRIGDVVRIVDYKTGLADDKELKFNDYELLQHDAVLNKSFQLLMYAWMYHRQHSNQGFKLQSGIITFRELSAGFKAVQVEKDANLTSEKLDLFQQQLEQLLEKLLSPAESFEQTVEIENCTYCPFKGVCNR